MAANQNALSLSKPKLDTNPYNWYRGKAWMGQPK